MYETYIGTAGERLNGKKRSSQLFTQLKQSVAKIKPEKNSGLKGNRTHDLCDAGASALPTELSSQLGAGHIVSS